ncbi:hypothetical protein [Halobacterium sp. CBA1126]|uniref:hypothetical protein n=1 Tax=Halobacterium sp. CBA1126 TaxID=2668074 RepID=UPI001E61445F|nr:hypothetical protein [Halobacterium sp. CBA1126]
MDARGAEELLAARQRVADGVPEFGGVLAGEFDGLAADGDAEVGAVRFDVDRLFRLGERDQERENSGSCAANARRSTKI